METAELALARLWRRVDAETPRDRPVLMFLPERRIAHNKGYQHVTAKVVRAIWWEDNRDERSEHRHTLMMKHDGFWAHYRHGHKPLPVAPTHWLPDLPFPLEYSGEAA